MSKIRQVIGGGLVFWCPGCNSTHAINTQPERARWSYNESPDRPTFTPSVMVTTRWSLSDLGEKDDVCHSFVTDGRIQFLDDCTHALAGQTVDIPEWPHAPGTYGGIEE